MSAKSEQILSILRKRYPCAEVPPNTWTIIAKEVGVGREYVRRVGRANGFTGPGYKRAKTAIRYACLCGKERLKPTLCRDCKHVELPCVECGLPVKRLATDLARAYGKGAGTGAKGQVFCNKTCFGRWLGKNYGKGMKKK